GIKAGLTFLLAILLTGIFHQGNWQRVYAAKDVRTMRRGFFVGGVLVIPFIFLMGLMGLAFVAQGGNGDASVALFEIVLPAAAPWLLVALIPLGLSLVMSSADTVISAVSSIVAVEGRRLAPNLPVRRLYGWSRSVIWLFSLPVVFVSAQGYSVLYLFLLADLLCCAAAFPVFYGLYSQRHDGFNATLGCLAGLAAGLWMFPGPSQPLTTLLESFLLAIFVPVAVILVLQGMRRTRERFAWSTLQTVVRGLDDRT
ncbi:MAG: sodium:solute symporter, partial [Pigmentiphaga sp.]